MIKLNNIQKAFGEERVLTDINLELAEEQTLSILGKSGSGKSTLLKILAGLETADQGSFTVEQTEMLSLAPSERGVVYLSQEPLLFPHMSVAQNLAYGLSILKVSKVVIKEQVEVLGAKLGIAEHLNKKPHQLSGGQKQRVSFGRALIINPNILLLDEPFGSLDTQTRSEMQELFRDIRQDFHITSFFVTHDLKEALLMGDQLAMMQDGKLKVYSSTEEFIAAPESGAASEINFWKQFNHSR